MSAQTLTELFDELEDEGRTQPYRGADIVLDIRAALPRYEAALRLAEARVAREDAWGAWGLGYGDGSTDDELARHEERDRASQAAYAALVAYREARQ